METPDESVDPLQPEVAELRASRERLAIGADADRRSIERELHDGPQQDLIALAVNLQHVRDLVDTDPDAARALLEEMGGDVDRALEGMATLAQRIYPPLLEAGGLGAALRAAAVSSGIRAKISVSGVVGCPPETAGAVYFCWLELLEGAGDGGRATIDVRVADGTLVFEVGATNDTPLVRSRDRIEALGGRLTIQSDPGNGIRVSGSLPVSR